MDKAPCGTTIIGHGGSVPGFQSFALQTPDLKRRLQFSATAGLGTGDPTPAYLRLLNEIFC